MNNHKDLEVWKKSIELTKNVYVLTNNFPKEEIYGLINQIRRASVSIPRYSRRSIKTIE
jgi:four helix bundle protein